MDDVRAVLDAAGSKQAALFGAGHGGQMCALFAATYPERTSALVLYATWPRLPGTPEDHRQLVREVHERFGRRDMIEAAVNEGYPSLAADAEFRASVAMAMRATASPSAAADFHRTLIEADITEVLPSIRVPTLILYRRPSDPKPRYFGLDPFRGIEEESRRLAAVIPDARAVALPGVDRAPFVGAEVPDEIERFLRAPSAQAVPDRVLATVLFTDIVRSTERATALGDTAWRDLLNRHRDVVRSELRRFQGVEIDTAGDGFFASFDGPARAIACAEAIVDASAGLGIEVRAGLHTGECERDDGKLVGIAVHIGQRVASSAGAGEVLVSSTVRDLVAGSGIQFQPRGTHELKGVGRWRLYEVVKDE